MAKEERIKRSNFLDRLYKIDQFLTRTNNPMTYSQIIEQLEKDNLGVTERQLRDDFKLIEHTFGIEIKRKTNEFLDNKQAVYCYSNQNTSVFAKDFTSNELEVVLNLIRQLTNYNALDDKETSEIFKKLKIELDHKGEFRKIVEYEKNNVYESHEFFSHFNTLYNAINNKEVILLEYKSYEQQGSISVFHPYYLKQYNSRWFCIGHKEDTDQKRDIDIVPIDDRIESIQLYNTKYPQKKKKYNNKHNSKNWQSSYFGTFIGVTKGKREFVNQELKEIYNKIENVELLIKKEDYKTVKYLTSKPIHPSQKIKTTPEGDSILELILIPNYELERFILSYSDVLTVINPPILKSEIEKRLQKSINNYK